MEAREGGREEGKIGRTSKTLCSNTAGVTI